MSDTSGTTAAPAAPAVTPAADGSVAAPAPVTGARRAAPGLSFDRPGMSVTEGMRSLLRGRGGDGAAAAASAAAAQPAAAEAEPAAPTEPRRRAAPTQRRGAAPTNGAAAAPAVAATPAATPTALDRMMEAFLPSGAADPGQQQQQPGQAQPQPAPVNTYLEGVPLTIAGQARNYGLPELTDLVSKGVDYTNKTQALAEHARQLSERAATIDQLLPIMVPEIERQLAALNGADPAPDWVTLANSIDPAEYNRQHAAWQARQQQRTTEQGRLAQLMEANQRQQEQQRQQRMRIGHAELVRTLPGWGDQATRTTLIGEMRTWGLSNGFPAGELDQVVEARHVVTIAKAMMFDRIVAGAKTQAPVVPQVRRGAAPHAPAPAAIRAAQERFDAVPNHKNGLAFLLAQRRGAAR